jgi:hypothetical protein
LLPDDVDYDYDYDGYDDCDGYDDGYDGEK